MIIDLRQSQLFTVEPDKRFATTYKLEEGVWKEMWRRYQMLDYTTQELCDYFHLKTGKPTSLATMRRWIWRTEIYSAANAVMNKGAYLVTSEFFGENEWKVIRELTKNLRPSASLKVKSLV